jgi:hypothetical protein
VRGKRGEHIQGSRSCPRRGIRWCDRVAGVRRCRGRDLGPGRAGPAPVPRGRGSVAGVGVHHRPPPRDRRLPVPLVPPGGAAGRGSCGAALDSSPPACMSPGGAPRRDPRHQGVPGPWREKWHATAPPWGYRCSSAWNWPANCNRRSTSSWTRKTPRPGQSCWPAPSGPASALTEAPEPPWPACSTRSASSAGPTQRCGGCRLRGPAGPLLQPSAWTSGWHPERRRSRHRSWPRSRAANRTAWGGPLRVIGGHYYDPRVQPFVRRESDARQQ